jgi:hypothetical protein
MSSAERPPPPLRPALLRAVRALCEAATPAAARAAADALDRECAAAFMPRCIAPDSSACGAASQYVYGTSLSLERTPLAHALLDAPPPVWVALLQSPNHRNVNLPAALFEFCGQPPGENTTPLRESLRFTVALGGRRVFSALLDALLAAEGPALRACANARREGSSGGGAPAMALDNLLLALVVVLSVWPQKV